MPARDDSATSVLAFRATGRAAGVTADAGDDTVRNEALGRIESSATAGGAITGVTSSRNVLDWGIGGLLLREETTNVAIHEVDSLSRGIDLGAGDDFTVNAGWVTASASADASADAVSDYENQSEVSAQADATARQRAG